jgi:hypothetical protein
MSMPQYDAVSEAIMKAAREHPLLLMYTDELGRTAVGNTVDGFEYRDERGQLMSSDEAEPFRLFGTGIVIRRGLFSVETPEK